VLHAFQKKSKQGVATPQPEIGETEMVKSAFHELGMDKPDELVAKSRLITLIVEEIRKRGLTQTAAGEILRLDQPNVSALMNEKISRFSLEKLMSFAGQLGFEVSIHVAGHGVKIAVPMPSAA
jgi:predicted XRE-type DNA-binding protein